MTETPRSVNPENIQPPAQEKAMSFSLSKLLECLKELTPTHFEYLESQISVDDIDKSSEGDNDNEIKSKNAAIVRKAVEALHRVKIGEDKNSELEKLTAILVDLINARDIIEDLVEKTKINPKFGNAIYYLVDAVYEVAPNEVRDMAEQKARLIDLAK